VIRVCVGALADQTTEAVLRPVRSDLEPVTVGSRDVGLRAGAEVAARLGALGALPVGGAVVTPAGNLTASFLIHVVVSAEDEPETSLTARRALCNGLRRAADLGIASVSVPPLAMGVGHLEAEEAARTLAEVLFDHMGCGAPPLDVTIVVANEYERGIFHQAVAAIETGRTF